MPAPSSILNTVNFSRYRVRLVERRSLPAGAVECVFEFTSAFAFEPGQYAWIELDIPQTKMPTTRRQAFSLLPLPGATQRIAILTRTSTSAYKKTLLSLEPGAQVIVHGPFGSAFRFLPEGPPVMLVAGGLGIAAFMALLRQVPPSSRSLTLLPFLHVDEALPYADELSALAKTDTHITLHPPRPDFVWDDTCRAALENESEWWISGPQAFVDHVTHLLLKQGVPEKAMRFERCYPHRSQSLTLAETERFRQATDDLGLLGMQCSPHHLVITDVNGVVLYANPAAQAITGYTLEEILGETPRLWGGVMRPEFYIDFWKQLRAGRSFSGEITNRRKSGALYQALFRVAPIRRQGEIIGFIASEEDITRRVELEAQLAQRLLHIEQERERDQALLQSIDNGVVAMDQKGKVLLVNDAAERMFGCTEAELMGKNFAEEIHAVDESGQPVPHSQRSVTRALETGEKSVRTDVYSRRDGSVFTGHVTLTPLHLLGKIFGMVAVIRDVTEERQIDQAKTEFVSLASHQLRTPLSAIGWYTEMLLAGDAGALTDEQRQYLQEIEHGNRRMTELVGALLDVSRLELGTFMVEPVPLSVPEIAQSVLAELGPSITEKQLVVTTSIAPDIPSLNADPKLLRMVFQNLLSNAVKYTPENGKIDFSLSIDAPAGTLLCHVADTGCGIPREQRDQIFTKLFRADNAKTKNVDGTGLGLYIVQSIMEHVGGRVWFESEEDQGSTFYFTLPLTGMHAKAGTKTLGNGAPSPK